MTHQAIGRSNDRSLAALSAAMVVPLRCIGFLVMPSIWCVGGGSPTGNPASTPRCVPKVAGKIKTARARLRRKQEKTRRL
jgi:hypothetical protein